MFAGTERNTASHRWQNFLGSSDSSRSTKVATGPPKIALHLYDEGIETNMRVAAKRMQELNLCAVWYPKSKESYYVGDITYALREIFDHGDIPDWNNFDRFIFGYRKVTALSDHMLKHMLFLPHETT